MEKENQKTSRRTFLTLGSAAAVSSVFASGNLSFAHEFNPTIANSKAILFVNPATALALVSTGLDVAIKVKELFSSKNNSDPQIKKQLAEIQRQNAKIISMLSDVLVILNNLGVTIRAGVRDELTVFIKETLNVSFQRFYETWAAVLESPDANDEAEVLYEEFFREFANLGRRFTRNETYGYAHFQTVGHTMSVEIWISRHLGKNRALRRQAAKTYAEYFERVLNPNEPDSVSAQIVQAEAQAKRLNTILEGADKFVAANPKSIVDKKRLLKKEGRKRVYGEIEGSLSGDRNSEYLYTESPKRTWTEYDDPPKDGGPSTKSLKLPDPIDTGDMSLAGRAGYWNSVRKVYLAALEDLKILDKSRETAKIYLDFAKETFSNP